MELIQDEFRESSQNSGHEMEVFFSRLRLRRANSGGHISGGSTVDNSSREVPNRPGVSPRHKVLIDRASDLSYNDTFMILTT